LDTFLPPKKRKMNILSTFNVQRHTTSATLPEFVFPLAMGYDLFSDETKIIASGTRAFIDTGLTISIPQGMYGSVSSRISLSSIGVDVHQIIYDPFSTHRVRILMTNNSPHDLPIQVGDKIAILVLLPMETPLMVNITEEILTQYNIEI
jgi:dUTP pyrophosphatase